jgi:glyoxylase I family protein
MQPIAGFHHVGLTVSDLDASAAWYADVLGMVELFREESPTRRAVVFGFADGGHSVGLVQHMGSPENPFDPTINGLDHLAFSVSSQQELRDWQQHLATRGISHSGPLEIPPGEILNFRDPDGIALALFWQR